MSGNKSGFKRFDFFEVDSAAISSSLATQSQAHKVGGYTLNCGAAESGTIALGDNNGNIIIADSRLFSGDNATNVQSSSDRIYKAFRGEVIGIGIILDSNHKFSVTPRHYLLAIGEEIIPTSDVEKSNQTQYCIKVVINNSLKITNDFSIIFPIDISTVRLFPAYRHVERDHRRSE